MDISVGTRSNVSYVLLTEGQIKISAAFKYEKFTLLERNCCNNRKFIFPILWERAENQKY